MTDRRGEADRIADKIWGAKKSAAYWSQQGPFHLSVARAWEEQAARLDRGEILDYDDASLLAAYAKAADAMDADRERRTDP